MSDASDVALYYHECSLLAFFLEMVVDDNKPEKTKHANKKNNTTKAFLNYNITKRTEKQYSDDTQEVRMKVSMLISGHVKHLSKRENNTKNLCHYAVRNDSV